ncbi:hypothetical protein [Fodinibius sediminis]|uniref:hypothetical protein n=1 Tax=Fodinibius sediminis TaxID=1214077 RepID=UPI00163D6CED|nr:hypothetical protein [Fodinibius sediminis]
MNNIITITEQRHRIWWTGTIIAALFTVLLTMLYWNQSNPLWIGILRLAAFILFTLTVFGILKLSNGPLSIVVEHTPTHLTIDYRQKEKTVRHEQFEQTSIEELVISQKEQPLWRQYVQSSSATIKIHFSEEKRNHYLFEFSGRPLIFSKSDLLRLKDFITSRRSTVGHSDTSPPGEPQTSI